MHLPLIGILHFEDVKLLEDNLHSFFAMADKMVGAFDVGRIRMRIIGRGEGAAGAAVRREPSITGRVRGDSVRRLVLP